MAAAGEGVPVGDCEHSEMMGWHRSAIGTLWPALLLEDTEPLSVEEYARITIELVGEVQRLRQVIAVRRQSDRIAEQIEKGYR